MATITINVTGKNSSGTTTCTIPVTFTYAVTSNDTSETVTAQTLASGSASYSGAMEGRSEAYQNALSNLVAYGEYALFFDNTVLYAHTLGTVNQTYTAPSSAKKTITKTHSAQSKTLQIKTARPVSSQAVPISIPAKTSYSVAYNANSGSSAPANQTKWYNEALTITTTTPVKDGYTFKGWATSADIAASGTVNYASGASYTTNAALSLYAVWELAYQKPVITSVTAERCTSTGADDDEGTYAKVTFDWAVFRSANARYYGGDSHPYNDNTIYEGTVTVGTLSETFTSTAGSGTETVIVGDGSFSTDSPYDVSISITDTQGIVSDHTTTVNGTLTTSYFPMDFNADGTALGLFMPAPDDKEGVFLGKDLFFGQTHWLDIIRPVGSTYSTVDVNFNPNVSWGGTWEKLPEGTILLAGSDGTGAGDTYIVGEDQTTASGYKEYGSNTHSHTTGDFTLGTNHIPAHTHGSVGDHRHLDYHSTANRGTGNTSTRTGPYGYTTSGASSVTGGAAGGHEHSSVGGGKAHNHGNTGDSSNMQKSIAVYIWIRTA